MTSCGRAGACLIVSLLASAWLSPAAAQMDFSGEWSVVRSQDNTDNPHLGEYVGLPLNREALRRAEIWDAAILSLPQWQCRPHSGAYVKRSASSMRISKQVDSASRATVAFHAQWPRSGSHAVYMDGRPHPPEHAPHTWSGFSTGEFQGDRLEVRTTHLKEDYYRRNGVPQSDRATLSEYLLRRRFRNEDYLTWVIVAYDPVYLTEPLIRSTEYRLDLNQRIPPYPCTVLTEAVTPEGRVPSHLPGTNDRIFSFADAYGLPRTIVIDGAQTMYPEYRAKLESAAGEQLGN